MEGFGLTSMCKKWCTQCTSWRGLQRLATYCQNALFNFVNLKVKICHWNFTTAKLEATPSIKENNLFDQCSFMKNQSKEINQSLSGSWVDVDWTLNMECGLFVCMYEVYNIHNVCEIMYEMCLHPWTVWIEPSDMYVCTSFCLHALCV